MNLEQELAGKTSELERQRRERERDMVDIVLNGIAGRIVSKESDILRSMSEKGNKQQAVREIVIREIVRAAEGLLWCYEYVERLSSEQRVRVFTGSHWEDIVPQRWRDFINKCPNAAGYQTRCAWIIDS